MKKTDLQKSTNKKGLYVVIAAAVILLSVSAYKLSTNSNSKAQQQFEHKAGNLLHQAIDKTNSQPAIQTTPVVSNPNQLSKDYRITWDFTEYDFGTIEEGTTADSVVFHFTVNSELVMMTSTVSHCGCTTGEWKPVYLNKGERGHITLKYDTKRTGYFNKQFEVGFNKNAQLEKLTIKGQVKPKK